MEAPKEIYLFENEYCPDELAPIWQEWQMAGVENIKYIRADLAELTWEDISMIHVFISEAIDKSEKFGTGRIYQEVLRRFNEAKQDEGK